MNLQIKHSWMIFHCFSSTWGDTHLSGRVFQSENLAALPSRSIRYICDELISLQGLPKLCMPVLAGDFLCGRWRKADLLKKARGHLASPCQQQRAKTPWSLTSALPACDPFRLLKIRESTLLIAAASPSCCIWQGSQNKETHPPQHSSLFPFLYPLRHRLNPSLYF